MRGPKSFIGLISADKEVFHVTHAIVVVMSNAFTVSSHQQLPLREDGEQNVNAGREQEHDSRDM